MSTAGKVLDRRKFMRATVLHDIDRYVEEAQRCRREASKARGVMIEVWRGHAAAAEAVIAALHTYNSRMS